MNPTIRKNWTELLESLVKKYHWAFTLIFLVPGLAQFWLTRYVPSLDGPQHLYNAQVLKQLLLGNENFSEFFRLNSVLVGYWTGHFSLTLLTLIFPPWLAEKLFLTTYLLAMFFAFRYLVRSILPDKDNLLVYLIFPFIFHNYLVLGYYSFSIAVIFFFLAFGYWIRKRAQFRWKEMLLFGALALGVFLSHALVFLFFGASFTLFFLLTSGRSLISGESGWKEILDRVWRLVVSVIPVIWVWAVYLVRVMKVNPGLDPATYSISELMSSLLRIRQLVGFHHGIESPAYIVLFSTIAMLILYSGFILVRELHLNRWKWLEALSDSSTWIFISLIFISAYFLAPDRISAGSLTHRFGLFFYLALLVFLATRKVPGWLQVFAVLIVLGVMVTARFNHWKFLKNLTEDVTDIRTLAPAMEDGSTVLSLNMSDNWIHVHFQLYAAVDRNIVHLNNPQCGGQFPVVWNEDRLPLCKTGEQFYFPRWWPEISMTDRRIEQVDYITVWHQKRFWESEETDPWKEILEKEYDRVQLTPRELGELYKRKGL